MRHTTKQRFTDAAVAESAHAAAAASLRCEAKMAAVKRAPVISKKVRATPLDFIAVIGECRHQVLLAVRACGKVFLQCLRRDGIGAERPVHAGGTLQSGLIRPVLRCVVGKIDLSHDLGSLLNRQTVGDAGMAAAKNCRVRIGHSSLVPRSLMRFDSRQEWLVRRDARLQRN
ncbi:hypothetical protein [Cupriavidus cauae]